MFSIPTRHGAARKFSLDGDGAGRARQFGALGVVALAGFALCAGSALPCASSARATNFASGDLFLAQGLGVIQWRDSNFNMIQTINTGDGGTQTGMRHHPLTGELWVTNFSSTLRIVHTDGTIGATVNTPGQTSTESVCFDATGNAYVGGPGGQLVKLGPTGNFLASWTVPTAQNDGPDWIDVCADGQTVLYTTEDSRIQRFDVAAGVPLADLADLSAQTPKLFAVRALPDDSVLVVSATNVVYRVSQLGNIMQTYTPTNPVGLFALALTPNGNEFWAGGLAFNGPMYLFDIASGNVLAGPMNSGPSGTNIHGIAVFGDLTAGSCPGDPMTPFCFPGQAGVATCPCNNPPTMIGRGCDNFGPPTTPGGAKLTAAGNPNVSAPITSSVVLTSAEENPTSFTIFLQSPNSSSTGIVFGAGVRCIANPLIRLYTGNAVGGKISRPRLTDQTIPARSAQVGDNFALSVPTTRYYMTYYRDPGASSSCLSATTFNCSQSGSILWQ